MGYTTDFSGSLQLSRLLMPDEAEYLKKFAETRRMKRDVNRLKELFGGAYGLYGNYGTEGEYFVGGKGLAGQHQDDSILDYNTSPITQPGLWCQWVVNDDNELEHDGGEKFYNYTQWLQYLIINFFAPWGIQLNGCIKWQGQDMEDRGEIEVKNNIMKVTDLE